MLLTLFIYFLLLFCVMPYFEDLPHTNVMIYLIIILTVIGNYNPLWRLHDLLMEKVKPIFIQLFIIRFMIF